MRRLFLGAFLLVCPSEPTRQKILPLRGAETGLKPGEIKCKPGLKLPKKRKLN